MNVHRDVASGQGRQCLLPLHAQSIAPARDPWRLEAPGKGAWTVLGNLGNLGKAREAGRQGACRGGQSPGRWPTRTVPMDAH